MILGVTASSSLCVTCASSIVASSYDNMERQLNISKRVAILALSLYVVGLGLGPIFIAPLSEFFGRRPIYLVSFGAFCLLGLPVTFANNVEVLFIFRFITGFCGSAFLSVAGGTVTDLYQPHNVYLPMAIYSASPFAGPELAPLYSGFANYFTKSFRWSFVVIAIWSAIQWVLILMFLPETYAPMILTQRARALRKETGNDLWRSEHECKNADRSLCQTLAVSVMRVPQLLVLEPMLLLLCLWSALLLGIIYLLFGAYAVVFVEGRGFNVWQTGLTFLGIFVGMAFGLASMPYWSRLYHKACEKNGGVAPPEARLPPAMPGAFLTVIGLFTFSFVTSPHVHWIAPVIAGAPFGAGLILIFISVFSFTADAYRPVAASAMACNSVLRSSFAAAFPLFSTQMYHRLGTMGATCLLAGLNVLMIPVPFLFYRYGAAIRARSRFTLS
ncbi:MFS general substrate transporter [Tilletiaria anomala UBC 951]|uniref:MFS general substrate transporter n=1 Tax=Tilletiaria anomala (strain ATCC 24038 / CBS 436.72 / UBC 951) TaxID=1037660 RepID=A0A066WJC7_TILAU|nr:MFS general substrate transporter [Tilletiaria anomala UBC 951]KDN52663.1 MFS general substrate transporter [Tilletiaria anomala UBC 951]